MNRLHLNVKTVEYVRFENVSVLIEMALCIKSLIMHEKSHAQTIINENLHRRKVVSSYPWRKKKHQSNGLKRMPKRWTHHKSFNYSEQRHVSQSLSKNVWNDEINERWHFWWNLIDNRRHFVLLNISTFINKHHRQFSTYYS